MLRRAAVACYQSINLKTQVALARLTQGSFFMQMHQPLVPAVQFLTIPLSNNHLSLQRGRQVRKFSALARSELSTPSSFQEDYDEWNSHGRVSHVTSEPIDDEIDFFKSQASLHALQRGFVLDELKHEDPFHFQGHQPIANSPRSSDHAVPLAIVDDDDDDDDFFDDDLDLTDDDY
jgi:hypothetical protein